MVNYILNKLSDVSLSKSVYFRDKSYKYDTVFLVAQHICNKAESEKIVVQNDEFKSELIDTIRFYYNLFTDDVNDTTNAERHIYDTLLALKNLNIIKETKKDDNEVIEILDKNILEFISTSIENAYIFLYLVAYKVFINDGLVKLYIELLNANNEEDKNDKIKELKEIITKKANEIGKKKDGDANNFKFFLLILNLVHDEKCISRNCKIGKSKVTPLTLAANKEGTKSKAEKDNFYVHDFRINYVKEVLRNYLFTNDLCKIQDTTMKKPNETTRVKNMRHTIFSGVPGCGKSYYIEQNFCNKKEYMERVVFHREYSYSDFVIQMQQKTNETKDIVLFDYVAGPLARMIKKAYFDPQNKYFLIIEEINRGDAASIFGDIFQLLDKGYSITNHDLAKVIYGDENHRISIPSNLSILATMNTDDQNTIPLDAAFTRRWGKHRISNRFTKDDVEMRDFEILDTGVTWGKFTTVINEIINKTNIGFASSSDKCIGKYFATKEMLAMPNADDEIVQKMQFGNFSENVFEYIWDVACKNNRGDIFNLSKNSNFEDILYNFVESTGKDRFVNVLTPDVVDKLFS